MEIICKSILSLIGASLITGILTDLSRKTCYAKQIKLICSLFLALVFLNPLLHLQIPDLGQISSSFYTDAEEAVREGDQMRIQSVASIIKEEAEAYLLKEARSIGANISVEIELAYQNPPIPISSTIKGCFDASSESTLSRILTQELGIPKENQTWIRQDVQSGSS